MWHTPAVFLPSSLLSIPDAQRQIEPTTVADHTIVHDGVIPARFTSRYTRDDPTAATMQLKAEIGPTQRLTTPMHVMTELSTWGDIFRTAMKHYLDQEEPNASNRADNSRRHALPMFTDLNTFPVLSPSSIAIDDPRPVIHDGHHIDRIDRRVVLASVDYEKLQPDTSDHQVVESAMYSLSIYLRDWLKAWYNHSVEPVRPGYSISELIDAKERIKAALQGNTGTSDSGFDLSTGFDPELRGN